MIGHLHGNDFTLGANFPLGQKTLLDHHPATLDLLNFCQNFQGATYPLSVWKNRKYDLCVLLKSLKVVQMGFKLIYISFSS